jgi:general secretion pathway protein M
VNLPQLTQRDRLALLIGGLFIVTVLIFFGIIAPYRASIQRLDARIAARQRQLKEMQALRQECLQLRRQLAATEQRMAANTDFSLFSLAENLSVRFAGRNSLVYMRPRPTLVQNGYREESVEIKLENIGLAQLARLLYAVDAGREPVQVKALRVKTRFDDRSLLDAVLIFSSYGRAS